MWGPNGDASFSAKPANFASFIPSSLISSNDLQEYIKLSTSEENKDRVKREAAVCVEDGMFGFPLCVVEQDDGKVAKFFGSE